MGLLSVVSVSIMIERYFALRRVSSSSASMARGFKAAIEQQTLDQIATFSEENGSIEARALGYDRGVPNLERTGDPAAEVVDRRAFVKNGLAVQPA